MKPVYQVKNTESGTYQNIETMFPGVAILKVDGMLERGEPVNIYTAQWVNSQEEDFLITTRDIYDNPIVIRKNVDIEVTFIVKQKYASSTIDVMTTHDNFVDYMTGSDVWIKSSYMNNKYVHCVCLKEYKPTNVRLQRTINDNGRRIDNSYVIGTITLHTLDSPKT